MNSLSKAKLKLFSSLHLKKYRHKEGMFLIEGKKMMEEALKSGFQIEAIICNALEISDKLGEMANSESCFLADSADFKKLSSQVNPEGIIVVIHIPADGHYLNSSEISSKELPEGKLMFLESVQDPGNMGTIIRTADWFGYQGIICSGDCVDLFNPKVLRSTMGSIFHLPVYYVEAFEKLVSDQAENIWAASLEGTAITDLNLAEKPHILIGSEAHGLSSTLLGNPNLAQIRIPGKGEAESLNAAVSAAILAYACSEA